MCRSGKLTGVTREVVSGESLQSRTLQGRKYLNLCLLSANVSQVYSVVFVERASGIFWPAPEQGIQGPASNTTPKRSVLDRSDGFSRFYPLKTVLGKWQWAF
jgi:hypothetical protein